MAYSGDHAGTRAYCISPYKTGTTYISGLFARNYRAMHEPMHHTTLSYLDDDVFLRRRSALLDLDLESSGFFADRLQQLRRISPSAPVLFLSRSPETWIGSVLSYFSKLDRHVSYNYVARLVFDPICRVPVEKFFSLGEKDQQAIVDGLIRYWIRVYSAAAVDQRALVVPLALVNQRIPEIEEFLGMRASDADSAWKRTNDQKRAFTLSEYIDVSRFELDVIKLGYDLG